MALTIQLNGEPRSLAELEPGASLADVVQALGLKGDRIATEWNGEIAPRSSWPNVQIGELDKLEIVHFVGGGRR